MYCKQKMFCHASAASPHRQWEISGNNAVVVGAGRVGRAIARMFPAQPILVGRGTTIPSREGPIFVCTTNDAVSSVVASVQQEKRKELVFFQNGMLLPTLEALGIQKSATFVLLYMSATEDGSIVDGKRTVVYGRWADAVCKLLARGGVQCRAVSWSEYQELLVEKLLWASIFWMMSAGLGGMPVGEIATNHHQDIHNLVQELLPLANKYMENTNPAFNTASVIDPATTGNVQASSGVVSSTACSNTIRHIADAKQDIHCRAADCSVTESTNADAVPTHRVGLESIARPTSENIDHVVEGLLAYSSSIASAVPNQDMAFEEFPWRNGFFLTQGATELHLSWLKAAGTPAELLLEYGLDIEL